MRHREFTTQEVCAAALGRIERLNPELNAVIGFDRQAASSESRAADTFARLAGQELGEIGGSPS